MDNNTISDAMRTPPVKPAKVEKPVKAKGVSQEEFNAFQNAIMEKLEEMSKPVITGSAAAQAPAPVVPEEGGVQTPSLVPPSWRAMTDEILGPEFEIELELPENGGQKFSVFVPLHLSNAHPDYKKTFKRDKRTKELGNTGIKGVKDWLLKVRRNLVKSGIKLSYYEDTQPQLISTR